MKNELNESILMTISAPILSGRSLEAFIDNLKDWKEVGLLSKWSKSRLATKIKLYVEGIDAPYIVNITGLSVEKSDLPKGRTKIKKALAKTMVGKVKSPFRVFNTFSQVGFEDIFETFLDTVEDDFDRDKARKANISDEEWNKFEQEMNTRISQAKKTLKKMKLVEKFQEKILSSSIGINLGGDINKMMGESAKLFSLKEELLMNVRT